MECPRCGKALDDIGCEKTTHCETCNVDWRLGNEFDGEPEYVEAKPDDPVWWDR